MAEWIPYLGTRDTLPEYEAFHRASEHVRAFDRDKIEPDQIDKLSEEFTQILERYSVPEESGNVPDDERDMPEAMCLCIMALAFEDTMFAGLPSLMELIGGGRGFVADTDDGTAAFSRLFRKTVTTPSNLDLLLRMTDANCRIGNPRLFAIHFLRNLTSDASTLKLKVPDGADEGGVEGSTTPLSVRLIRASAKSLEDHVLMDLLRPGRQRIAHSNFSSIVVMVSKLMINTIMACSTKLKTQAIEGIRGLDWVAIFDYDGSANPSVNRRLFVNLHRVVAALLILDPDNNGLYEFLQKLGSCRGMFNRTLRDIASGKFDVEEAIHILNCFVWSFVPAPTDRKTEKLVKRAYAVLQNGANRPRQAILVPGCSFDQYGVALSWYSPSGWGKQQRESDEDRWKRFEETQLGNKVCFRDAKKDAKQQMHGRFSRIDMCANCFVLEKDLQPPGRRLQKCSRCMQISYCCKGCQGAHWKSAHKKQCKKQETAAASVGGRSG